MPRPPNLTRHAPFIAIGVALIAAAIVATAVQAGPVAKAPITKAASEIEWPSEPCNLEHRMDIAIVDGMFFECQCLRLLNGYQCDWYLIAGVNSTKLKRHIKRPGKGLLVRVARTVAVHA